MEILASALAIYLLAKFGWPVIKFLAAIVILAMIFGHH
jgi:hypothetical protein